MKKYLYAVIKYDPAKVRIIDLQTQIINTTIQAWEFFNKRLLKYFALLYLIAAILVLPYTIRKILLSIQTGINNNEQLSDEQIEIIRESTNKDIAILDKKINSKIPKGNYLIINTSSNEFSLYKGSELIKKDKCSTGSYVLLKNGDNQQWMFKTPKGEFRIQHKRTFPVWKKPDWAFVEEGLPVPPPNHSSRFEYGVLGDYALSLGDGYLIHGTLYQRFLGLPVTHGCVRLNDENLELVYKSLKVGSKVYIY